MEFPSPVDLPEPEMQAHGLGWTAIALTIASLLLLATNAVSLRDWIDEQPPGPVQAQAAIVADRWLALTTAVGLSAPRDVMHQEWKGAEEARFPATNRDAQGGAADQR